MRSVRRLLRLQNAGAGDLPGSPFAVGTGAAQLAVDGSGKFLYVPSLFDNDIWGFTINGISGELTAMPGSPFAAGTPSAVITHP